VKNRCAAQFRGITDLSSKSPVKSLSNPIKSLTEEQLLCQYRQLDLLADDAVPGKLSFRQARAMAMETA
jgi:hypothetical protein